jgi:hypothetical protein
LPRASRSAASSSVKVPPNGSVGQALLEAGHLRAQDLPLPAEPRPVRRVADGAGQPVQAAEQLRPVAQQVRLHRRRQ